MQYIEAPHYTVNIARLPKKDNLFLAGSITGTGDWQSKIVDIPYDLHTLKEL